jgi:hypothetical protein
MRLSGIRGALRAIRSAKFEGFYWHAIICRMNIRRLTAADLEELVIVICAGGGCAYEANWEVASERESLPNAGPVTSQAVRFYCDLHARRVCLEANLELPALLRLD